MLITLMKYLRRWEFLQRERIGSFTCEIIVFNKEMTIGRIDKRNMVQTGIFLGLL